MAKYNRAMNTKIYDAVATLPVEQHTENRGAFFGSIIGTLNHILVGDIIWLKRLSLALQGHSELKPVHALTQATSLDTVLFTNLQELKTQRKSLDELILLFTSSLNDDELWLPINYKNMKGDVCTKNLFPLLAHVFNHQTHHRGQITTLLSQSGIDIGVTDFVAYIPER